ncbi:uncharacterized protein [Argopecten irradians]|uniref:uncharacterized protein n=1 Tax=Argopecten irradians TaxID=31199 RepID=UPI003717EC0F
MEAYVLCALVVLTVRCDALFVDDGKTIGDGNEEKSLTSELVDLLNGTYFHLNEKVCNLQRRVDVIEKAPDSGSQCTCNNTEILDFMRSVSTEIDNLSKALHSFENEVRILKNGQASLWEILGKGSDDGCNETMTTAAPVACDDGWVTSPTGKCYYVSLTSEKTTWSTAIQRCSDMGATLAEFKTDEEAQFVMNNLPPTIQDNDYLYTGRERNDEGVWVYLSNKEKVDTAVRTWGDGEPDSSPQDCGCTKLGDNFLMCGLLLYWI